MKTNVIKFPVSSEMENRHFNNEIDAEIRAIHREVDTEIQGKQVNTLEECINNAGTLYVEQIIQILGLTEKA